MLWAWRSTEEYKESSTHAEATKALERLSNELIKTWNHEEDAGSLRGFCSICQKDVDFHVDLAWGGHKSQDGTLHPNWRESISCRSCEFNQRSRSTLRVISSIMPSTLASGWICEATTPLYRKLQERYPLLVGSEFVGPGIESGARANRYNQLIRHEDCIASSFTTGSLDFVLSFDVLEHIPDFKSSMAEAHRVLREGGVYLWSAPTNLALEKTQVRATLNEDGSITHLLAPEYHGDPMREEGILCYQTFGWDALEAMSAAGFKDSFILGELNTSERCIFNIYAVGIKRHR